MEDKKKALPLHPQSEINTIADEAKPVLSKFFKKSHQKIWWFKNNDLSLHRFSALKKGGIENGSSKQLEYSSLKKLSS